ncbi:immunity 49 family protein [Salmonirosea aquatica]|uniref:Uncharacterized protein n=1 Tax=Salmonirosea aquatica TaxID=2654236 RepID=A0A7C9BET0_9BACT|nr:hypothetical protein [Cytophagaceae bacterium SJW1-29]
MILEPYTRLSGVVESFRWLLSREFSVLNGNTHSTRWTGHHVEGWFCYLIDKNAGGAKQKFYLCGRLDEALMPLQNAPAISSKFVGGNISFSDALDGYFHWTDTLLSDNSALIYRRPCLTYPERERYLFKEIYPLVVINVAIEHLILDEISETRSILQQIEKIKVAKRFMYDVHFIDSLIKGDKDNMVKAIEGVASAKIHKPRQKVNPETGPWENELLSMAGITYTKLAWMYGYELEIKNPLVSIANELYPVKPFAHYEETYDFSKGE